MPDERPVLIFIDDALHVTEVDSDGTEYSMTPGPEWDAFIVVLNGAFVAFSEALRDGTQEMIDAVGQATESLMAAGLLFVDDNGEFYFYGGSDTEGSCPERTCLGCPAPAACAWLRGTGDGAPTVEMDTSTEGMLLSELLDESTLAFIEKQKAKGKR